jgi:hypothetical protein
LIKAIEKLAALGFKPYMLQSQKHNFEKIREVGKKKIIKILAELSRKGTFPRKMVSIHKTSLPKPQGVHEKT